MNYERQTGGQRLAVAFEMGQRKEVCVCVSPDGKQTLREKQRRWMMVQVKAAGWRVTSGCRHILGHRYHTELDSFFFLQHVFVAKIILTLNRDS